MRVITPFETAEHASPGPWVEINAEVHTRRDYTSHQRLLAITIGPGARSYGLNFTESQVGITNEEAFANARLMAAAPDLYTACRAALSSPAVRMLAESYEEGQPERALYDRLRAAIAKAGR